MPNFVTFYKDQKPMALQQTQERIQITKLYIFIKKSISKRKEKEDSLTLETKGDGFKKFQIAITIGGHLQKVMESQVAKCCCKTTTKKKTTKP
jgi:hypothetical protein